MSNISMAYQVASKNFDFFDEKSWEAQDKFISLRKLCVIFVGFSGFSFKPYSFGTCVSQK